VRQYESSPKWHPPRAELNKFDGAGIIDWLVDCEFYFDIYNTAEQFKVKIFISYLIGDAREWYRYFKMNNYDPLGYNLKMNYLIVLILIPKIQLINLKGFTKSAHWMNLPKKYERIKARGPAKYYSDEEFYLLGFLSGLKEEIIDAVILYEPTSLKYAIKITKKVEKTLNSQTKVLRPTLKYALSLPPKLIKFKDFDKFGSTHVSNSSNDQPSSKTLTVDKKCSISLYYKCNEKYYQGHRCKS
jgi:hypothetical protein